uniref:Uncharacterized protein n=1 Tax=uncultured marine bacterium 582 TaxID=257402 RepID=Q6SF66_9BACT|nr:hypothetical protein MBMO_EBAC080-L028H02.18 [uncultured marine bacterium 582]
MRPPCRLETIACFMAETAQRWQALSCPSLLVAGKSFSMLVRSGEPSGIVARTEPSKKPQLRADLSPF